MWNSCIAIVFVKLSPRGLDVDERLVHELLRLRERLLHRGDVRLATTSYTSHVPPQKLDIFIIIIINVQLQFPINCREYSL